MQIRKPSRSSLLLCLALAFPLRVHAKPTINFTPAPTPGSSITVTGTAGASVSVYILSDATACKDESYTQLPNPVPIAFVGLTPSTSVKLPDGNSHPISLSTAITAGDTVCLASTDPSGTAYAFANLPVPAGPAISFASNPVDGGSSISVKGDSGARVTVRQFPPGYAKTDGASCTRADFSSGQLVSIGAQKPTNDYPLPTGSSPFSITLNKPLLGGAQLCLFASETVSGTTTHLYSPFVTVGPAPTASLRFTDEPVKDSASFNIASGTPGTVRVYLFGADQDVGSTTPCDQGHGTQLPLSGNSTPPNTVSIPETPPNSPQTVTLANNATLTAGTVICLLETAASDSTVLPPYYKRVSYFAPGEDYGRFLVNLTGGVMISNQQQATNSSTASQYFNLGLSYTLKRPPTDSKANAMQTPGSDSDQVPNRNWFTKHDPGASTLMDIRLTTIPVATSTNSATTANGTTTLSESLNVLSSEQSATVLMGAYFPFRLTHWYQRSNWITAAPVLLGGFDTLLNPPTTTATTASSGSVSSTTTSNFSSVYNFWAGGARFGWDIYPKRTDEAPIEYSWVSLTLGYYSNLPSWQCTVPASATTPPASVTSNAKFVTEPSAPTTSCYFVPTIITAATSTTPADTGPPYTVYESRKLVPRVNIAGELQLPNYPVVFGYDANLGQYGRWLAGNGIDIQNRPGNDVRFYFGLKFNISTALKKLGIPSS